MKPRLYAMAKPLRIRQRTFEVWYAVAVMLSERIDPITGKERGQEVPLSLPYFDSEALIQSGYRLLKII